jgi:hypothetical protein
MQSRVSPHEFFLMTRQDFEIFNLDNLKMEHSVVESFLKHFDKHPFKLDSQIQKFSQICGSLPKNLEKKRRICNFLVENLTPCNIQLEDLVLSLDEGVQDRSRFLEHLGRLL